eukprot:1157472-Pelagomonas_calceolata.AAC.2
MLPIPIRGCGCGCAGAAGAAGPAHTSRAVGSAWAMWGACCTLLGSGCACGTGCPSEEKDGGAC